MPIDASRLLSHEFPEIAHTYVERDAILYALGVGLGEDPTIAADLAFLYENGLRVLPTFAVTLASPGLWIKDPAFGVDFARLVHSEQAAVFFRPLPPRGRVVGTAKIISLTDRGEGKGAVLTLQRTISDADNGTQYCTLQQTLLLRGDGGFGGPEVPQFDNIIPARAPDLQSTFSISPRAALIYRLSGDWNPLHVVPEAAAKAGFPRPILHGLATYGAAAVATARALGRSPDEVVQIASRFSGIVYPGEEIVFHIWRTDEEAAFQGYIGERKVLDQGRITFADDA